MRRIPIVFLLAILLVVVGCGGAAPRRPVEAYRPPGSWVSTGEYAARRARLMERIPDGVAILAGATEPPAAVPFRQNNDFFYLTGVEVPGAFLVVDGVERRSALFFSLTERGARGEGIPLDFLRDPGAATGIEAVHGVDELAAHLEALHTRGAVFYTPHFPQELPAVSSLEGFSTWKRTIADNPWDGRPTRQQSLVQRLRERFPNARVKDCSPLLWELRKIKSPGEIGLIRRAARIAVDGHRAVIRSAGPGVDERELAALFEFICRKEGAQGLAYYTILMAGPHHPFGHYHRYDRVLEEGDFVILDAGPEFAYYDADVSTSFPAGGVFSPRQRELYELAAGVHRTCLAGYRPGRTLRDVGGDVADYLTERGLDPAEERFRYVTTWGGYNHPIGMAVHDVMGSMRGPDEVLQSGFVFACDINMPREEELGIRIEDTVVITPDGCEVLSAGLPRTVAEIEALMEQPGLLQRLE